MKRSGHNYPALVRVFRDSKIMYSRGVEAGDEQIAGKGATEYMAAAEELLRSGEGAIEAFAALLEDELREVRVAAASYLLPHRTAKAMEVLKEAANGKCLTALTARMALARWKGGEKKVWEDLARISEDSRLPKRRRWRS